MAALDYLKQRGFTARQVGAKLRVMPKERLTTSDRSYIKLHRMEILAELAANDGQERRLYWKVYRQGAFVCVITGGPMSREEALVAAQARWPDADVRDPSASEADKVRA